MITPKDIDSKVFNRSVRGYNTAEVDVFLDEVSASIGKMLKHIDKLESRIDELENRTEKCVPVKETQREVSEEERKILLSIEQLKQEEEALQHKAQAIKKNLKQFLEDALLDVSSVHIDSLSEDNEVKLENIISGTINDENEEDSRKTRVLPNYNRY